MLDIKWIRSNPEALDAMLIKRGGEGVSSRLIAMDETRRSLMTEAQEVQARRNSLSKEIGIAKSKGEDAAPLFEEMKTIGPKVKELEEKVRTADEDFHAFVSTLPNKLAEDVPLGKDDTENEEVRRWGEPRKFDFEPKHHADLGEALGGFDFETAAQISGSRFVWLQGDLARLERAIMCFMLDYHRKNGFLEVAPPLLVTPKTMYGTGQFPKFEEDAFITNDSRDLCMIPTSEVPVTNFMQERLVAEGDLPFKFTAYTPNFRKEAGSAGKDTRGYIRMHQFGKVEMVQIVHPEKSKEAHENMLNYSCGILEALKLPYRVMNLCSGDIGFASMKTYDPEVWVPAQNTYREIASISNCGDFQARRMNGRFKDKDGKNHFVHTLNGSGLATGRTLVAVMENYQQEDGSIIIPEVLRPYMGGQDKIEKRG